MSTPRIAAWIGALSLAGLGLVAVAGIVALRYLDAGHLGRVITGADGGPSPALVSFVAQRAEGDDAYAAGSAGQADPSVPTASDPDAAARRDCLELLAKGDGEGPLRVFSSTTERAEIMPGVAIRIEGGPMDGTGPSPLGLTDPLATLARLLGLDSAALHKALDQDGKTLADLAKAQGQTLEQLSEALQTEARAQLRGSLQAKVDAGELSPEEADRQAQALELKLGDEAAPDKGLRFTMKLKAPHFLHPGKQGAGDDAAADAEADVVMGFAAAQAPGAHAITLVLPDALSDADQAAVQKVLEEAVAAGRLTRAQADGAIGRLKLPSLPDWQGLPAVPAIPAIPGQPADPSGAARPASPASPARPASGAQR